MTLGLFRASRRPRLCAARRDTLPPGRPAELLRPAQTEAEECACLGGLGRGAGFSVQCGGG